MSARRPRSRGAAKVAFSLFHASMRHEMAGWNDQSTLICEREARMVVNAECERAHREGGSVSRLVGKGRGIRSTRQE